MVLTEDEKKERKRQRNKKYQDKIKSLIQQSKEDKVYTFIPLLHLTTQRKIDLFQQKQFL